MRLIKQKELSGCGIAAVAMITGKSYDEIIKLNGFDCRKHGTTTWHLHHLLIVLGYYCPNRLIPFRKMKFTELEVDAILKSPFEIGRGWHWLVWDADRGRVLDPIKHLSYFGRQSIRPTSYLPVWRVDSNF